MRLTIRTKGMEEIRQALNMLPREVAGEHLREVALTGAEVIRAEAKQNALQHKRTGTLAGDIHKEVASGDPWHPCGRAHRPWAQGLVRTAARVRSRHRAWDAESDEASDRSRSSISLAATRLRCQATRGARRDGPRVSTEA